MTRTGRRRLEIDAWLQLSKRTSRASAHGVTIRSSKKANKAKGSAALTLASREASCVPLRMHQYIQLITPWLLISARSSHFLSLLSVQYTPSASFIYSKFSHMATRFLELEKPLQMAAYIIIVKLRWIYNQDRYHLQLCGDRSTRECMALRKEMSQ